MYGRYIFFEQIHFSFIRIFKMNILKTRSTINCEAYIILRELQSISTFNKDYQEFYNFIDEGTPISLTAMVIVQGHVNSFNHQIHS